MALSFSFAFTKARAAALDWTDPRGKSAGFKSVAPCGASFFRLAGIFTLRILLRCRALGCSYHAREPAGERSFSSVGFQLLLGSSGQITH
jgi:hypothetical protein